MTHTLILYLHVFTIYMLTAHVYITYMLLYTRIHDLMYLYAY